MNERTNEYENTGNQFKITSYLVNIPYLTPNLIPDNFIDKPVCMKITNLLKTTN